MSLVFALILYKVCFGLYILKNYLKPTEFLFLTFHPNPSSREEIIFCFMNCAILADRVLHLSVF